MAKRKKKDAEDYLCKFIHSEFDSAENQDDDDEFESTIDLLECKRTEKDYEWMSDVFLPEYPSIHLTEASQWANQYFQSRDFVEVALGSTDEKAIKTANAAKKYLNTMLNVKELHHYQKYMRARAINSTRGCVYCLCGWKQVMLEKRVPKIATVKKFTDEGQPYLEQEQQEDVIQIPAIDRFEYEVIDPRNVRTDNKYVYSIQDKDWITFRSQMSYEELKSKEAENGYINLDKLKKVIVDEQSETEKKTTAADASLPVGERLVKRFDVLERYGKHWAIVTKKDNDGRPIEVSMGIDNQGNELPKAEFIEIISAIAYTGNTETLIRFQPLPFYDAKGNQFRPVLRGLCYVHPIKDVGISDGRYAKETQVLINDMINMAIDRSKLSMMPTLKVRRLAWEDNDSIYFEPEHAMIVEQPDDVTEFKIDGNCDPAFNIITIATNKMQQLESIYPTTMGDMPGKASTTATAVAGAQSNTNLRGNYKALTFEYTFLTDFYWMMMQMGYEFMHPETAMAILGPDAQFFDPNAEYSYSPVTSNIETEYNKTKKIQNLDQMMGRLVNFQNPAIVPIIAAIIAQQFELMGVEYERFGKMIERLAQTPMQPEQPVGPTPADAQPVPTSNQVGNPMMVQEEMVRGMQ